MVQYLEQPKAQIAPIIAGILLIIAGACVAFIPGMSLTIATAVAGACFLVSGVVRLVQYVRMGRYLPFLKDQLPMGIINVVIGLLFVIFPFTIGNALLWIVAIGLFVFAAVELFTALNKRKDYGSNWQSDMVIAIIACVAGIFVILVPGIIGLIVGLFVIVNGIVTIQAGLPQKQ